MKDISKILKKIKNEAVEYKRTSTRKQLPIPDEVADFLTNELTERYNTPFSIPIKELNEAIGFAGNLERQRALSIKHKLNMQHVFNDEKMQWHIGTTEQGTRYIIAIEEKQEEE